MLRITDGKADHVGATSSIGGYTNGTVNESWGGLTQVKPYDSYVLTAESSNAANNTSGNNGIIGTGYNDTFFGSAGNDTYSGGGGWNQIVSGNPVWSKLPVWTLLTIAFNRARSTRTCGQALQPVTAPIKLSTSRVFRRFQPARYVYG
ncbi:hypothetical protein KIF59_23205 [Enterobacter cloacae subsp. cloacae]|nr:hypothetical protein [Enterobacter cloacae subsp. cloacae]